MSPEFAAAVDPVVRHLLDLVDRMTAGEVVDPQDVRRRVVDRLERAEAMVGATAEWPLAKYALVAWTDELLLDVDWAGREWWSNNVLEVEQFRSRDCSERFFVKAEEARRLSSPDALEVFYDCVVLGFRGMYRSPEVARSLSRPDGLPDSLQAWCKRTAMALQRSGATPLVHDGTPPLGAPPRSARPWVVGTALLLFALTVVDVLVFRLVSST